MGALSLIEKLTKLSKAKGHEKTSQCNLIWANPMDFVGFYFRPHTFLIQIPWTVQCINAVFDQNRELFVQKCHPPNLNLFARPFCSISHCEMAQVYHCYSCVSSSVYKNLQRAIGQEQVTVRNEPIKVHFCTALNLALQSSLYGSSEP